MFEEAKRFLIFAVFLSAVSVFFSELRSLNKEFLNADSGIRAEDNVTLEENRFLDRYIRFWKGLLTLDMGKTESGDPVLSHIASRFWPTAHLSLFAILTATLSSVGLALFSLKPGFSFLRDALSFLSKLILSTPVFVVAVFLLVVFFAILGWLPPGGYEDWNSSYVILPGIALGSRVFARIFLFATKLGEDEEKSGYITVLEARGYSKNRILFRHILLKIFPVLLILILLDLSSLLSGAIVVEEIFFFPGIGKSMYHAIRVMDSGLLAALLFYSGAVFYLLTRISERVRDRLLGWEASA
ncbi:ABC transporter permease subunit [Leptospira wolffii]|uniref:ABC transporter permease subunit n=1 Tax=Leptospira wolffii TaxID=409998 RepID=A0ABV5BK13_9LEPT|nr:ABC transporter permease subunit [Leptospira wolffii]EPG64560.1 ABC transporter, permease protein [Leptospira wolffii serovar Khorat str. Khorat-H2]TGL49219.1 ABC transporter permease subunit [Leptospira wolffii]